MSLGRSRALVVADHLVDDEAQELLAELRVEIGLFRQRPQPRDLSEFAIGIGGRQGCARLVLADRLRDPEPFGQHVDDRGVDIVDALAKRGQRRIGPGFRRRGGKSCRNRRALRFVRHRARS